MVTESHALEMAPGVSGPVESHFAGVIYRHDSRFDDGLSDCVFLIFLRKTLISRLRLPRWRKVRLEIISV